MLSRFFDSRSVIGFSGSRRPGGAIPAHVLLGAIASVPSSAEVVVGCASGVDAVVRVACPHATVFTVASGQFGRGKSAFARRSIACVQAVANADCGGLWVSFPGSMCPPGLLPSASSSRCFSGSGSGSWASLAYALGCGIPCLVFSPCGIPSAWALSPVLDCIGWFGCDHVLSLPAAHQLSLL